MKPGRNAAAAMAGCILSLAAISPLDAADVATPMPAKAPTPAPSGWTFEFTPYFWMSGLGGDTQVGPRAPVTNIDLSFSKLIQHTGFAAMGVAELRNGRFGLVGDMIYLSLAADATGPAGYVNAQLKDKTFIGTFNLAYRVIDSGPYWVDLTGGMRAWDINMNLGFDIVPLGRSLTYSLDKSWVDPIVGMRARADLGAKFFIEGYADVGGFGAASKSTWQLAGLLGYQYSPTTSLMAGWRYLAVDYDRDGFLWDIHMSGPIMAVNIRF